MRACRKTGFWARPRRNASIRSRALGVACSACPMAIIDNVGEKTARPRVRARRNFVDHAPNAHFFKTLLGNASLSDGIDLQDRFAAVR